MLNIHKSDKEEIFLKVKSGCFYMLVKMTKIEQQSNIRSGKWVKTGCVNISHKVNMMSRHQQSRSRGRRCVNII